MAKAAVQTGVKAGLPATKDAHINSALVMASNMDLVAYNFLDKSGMEAFRDNLEGMDLSPADLERIKFPSGGSQFWEVPTLDGDTEPMKSIDGIVLMYKTTRAYWKEDFTGAGIAPDCSCKDTKLGIGEGNPGGMCATCPMQQWGSASNGNGGKACKEVGLAFVMTPGNMLPKIVPVPPKSLRPMKKFMVGLSQKNISHKNCILSIGLEKAQNKSGITYSEIRPKFMALLPEEAKQRIAEYVKDLQVVFTMTTASQTDLAPDGNDTDN